MAASILLGCSVWILLASCRIALACTPSNTTALSWVTATNYNTSSLVAYSGVLYICLQAHESQDDWVPPSTPDLWATPTPCGITPWNTQTLYQMGSDVIYNGVAYTCILAH